MDKILLSLLDLKINKKYEIQTTKFTRGGIV